MDTPRDRAEQRRALWTGGVAHSFAEAQQADLEFWAKASPLDRLRGVTELLEEMLLADAPHEAPARLQRSVGGVRPRRG